MANIVSTINYNNTFGDWVITTNALVVETNNLAANAYIKQTGTLYLDDPTLGLQVANNASIGRLTLGAPLPVTSGGTGATTSVQALTNLLPSNISTPAGYVLATGGPGTYYWAAGGSGGGGGATPGTTINSTRIYPTVNAGQTIFSTPTYVVGASQLRVYVNGVRQFNTDYTETSNTVVTLSSGTASGDIVLLEVDGYTNYVYYANNIAFTSPFGEIIPTANTIQLAIQDLETKKASLVANNTFTNTIGVGTGADSSNTGSITSLSVSTRKLTVTGNAAVTGTITATGTITSSYSDERLKTKLGNIESALDKVCSLNGFYFEPNEIAKELGYELKKDVGVSAQEVERVLPEVIARAPINENYLTVHYEKIVPLLIEAIKELKQEVESLKR